MDAQRLSRILFKAREEIEMWADVVERRSGARATHTRRLIEEIDEYRREQGWNPNGYGNEGD